MDLVETDELSIRLVAGVDAAYRSLSGAGANEHADPTPWFHGGELLMTDGLEMGRSKARITGYVERIAAAGVAALALGIGEGLPFERVPRALVQACDAAGLPLLEVPSSTAFARISEAVYSRLAEARFGEAPRLVEAQRALTRAAARPGSSPAVVGALARLTGLWVALSDPRGVVVTAADDVRDLPESVARAVRAMAPRGLHGTAVVPHREGYVRVQAVGAEDVRGFLAYGTEQGAIDEFQGAAAAFAVSLLSIDLERQHVVRMLKRRPREEAAARLVRGMNPAAATRLLGSLGLHAERLRIVVAEAEAGAAELLELMADALPEALVGVDRSCVTLVVAADLPDLVTRLQAVAPGRSVGIGGPVPPHLCPASLRQARRGVQLAQRRGGGIVDVMTLGSARMLLESVPPDMLESYADATLRPIESADGGDGLVRSLRAWLDAGTAADAAAAAVGVHRHTMRHRLRRIEELTGRRLDDANDRGELWLAFEARDLAATAHVPPPTPEA
ncbi:PucR family transcriptional regulator ligand-binding domain-containing protein [Embleya sp. NPDC001921]